MERAIFMLLLCVPVVISNPCANQTLGSQPYPGDCGAYIVCWLSMPYMKACPNNLFYDTNTKSCQPLHLSICCNVTFQATTHQSLPPIPSISTSSPNVTIPTLPPVSTTKVSRPSSSTLEIRNTITSVESTAQTVAKLTTRDASPQTTVLFTPRLTTEKIEQPTATTQKSFTSPTVVRPTTTTSVSSKSSTNLTTSVRKIILEKSSPAEITNRHFSTKFTSTTSLSPIMTTTINKSTFSDLPSTSLNEKTLSTTESTTIVEIVPTTVSLSPELISTIVSNPTSSTASEVKRVSTNTINSSLFKKNTTEPSSVTRPVTKLREITTMSSTIEPLVTTSSAEEQPKTNFPLSTPITTKTVTIKPSSSIVTKIPAKQGIVTPTTSFSPIRTTTIIKSTLTDSPSTNFNEKTLMTTESTTIAEVAPSTLSLSPEFISTTVSNPTPSKVTDIATVFTNINKSTLFKKNATEPSLVTRPVTNLGEIVATTMSSTIEPLLTTSSAEEQQKTNFPFTTPITTETITIKPSSSIVTKIPATQGVVSPNLELTSLPSVITKSPLITTSPDPHLITTEFSTKKGTNKLVSIQTSITPQTTPNISSTWSTVPSTIGTSDMSMTSESIISSTHEITRESLSPETNVSGFESTKTYLPTIIIERETSTEPVTTLRTFTKPNIIATILNPMTKKTTTFHHSTQKSPSSPVTLTTLKTMTQTFKPAITKRQSTITEKFTSHITPKTLSPESTEPTLKETSSKSQSSTFPPLPSFIFTTKDQRTPTLIPVLTTKQARTELSTIPYLINATFTSVAIESTVTSNSLESSAKSSFPPIIVKTIEPTQETLQELTTTEGTRRRKITTPYTESTILGSMNTKMTERNTKFYSTIQSSIPTNIAVTETESVPSLSPTLSSVSVEIRNNSFTVPIEPTSTSTQSIPSLTSTVSEPKPIYRPSKITPIFRTTSTPSILTSASLASTAPYTTNTASTFTASEPTFTTKHASNTSRSIPNTISSRIKSSTETVTLPIESNFTSTFSPLPVFPTSTVNVPISTLIKLNVTPTYSSPSFTYSTQSTTSSKSGELPSTLTTNIKTKPDIITEPGITSIGKTTTFSTTQTGINTIIPSKGSTKFVITEYPRYRPYSRPTTIAKIPIRTDYISTRYESTTSRSRSSKSTKPTLPPISTTQYILPCLTTPKTTTTTITNHLYPLPICRLTDRYLYPDLANCSSYYKCFYGTVRKLKCKYGYQFNPRALKCMPRIEANCLIVTAVGPQRAFLSEFIQLHNLQEEVS